MTPHVRSMRLLRRIIGPRGLPHYEAVDLVWRVHLKVGGLFRHIHPCAQKLYSHRGWLIGMVRATEYGIQFEISPHISAERDAEFKKRKYKAMPAEQLQMQKDLFELSLTLQGYK